MIDTLFEPVTIGELNLRNRTVMAPMTRWRSPGGVPEEGMIGYYRRRAEGGIGLIISEGMAIDHPACAAHAAIPNFHGTDALAQWARIIGEVQRAGSALVPQFWHTGGFRSTVADPPNPAVPSLSASGIYLPGVKFGEPATQADIDAVIAAYGEAARTAMDLGCDGIEINGAHGYLLDGFFWGETNRRSDRYGGGLVDRTRFACEVIAECRSRTRPGFPIFFRFSQWKVQDYTAKPLKTPTELEGFLEPLVEAGVDVFDCSTRRFWTPEFEGSDLNLAGWTRKLSGQPTITVGSVGLESDVLASVRQGEEQSEAASLDHLERMLERGDFDLVGIGRAVLADPHWVNKVKAGNLAGLKGFSAADLEVLT